MKYKYILFLIIFDLYCILSLKWPTEKTPPARKLPSLEVRVSPPQEYQPKVQAEIKLLDDQREALEYKSLENLEKKYNEELINAGKKIKSIIDQSLKLFENPDLLKKSVEFAANPPILPTVGKKAGEFLFKQENMNNLDENSYVVKENHEENSNFINQTVKNNSFISIDDNSNNTERNYSQFLQLKKELVDEDRASKIFRSEIFLKKLQEEPSFLELTPELYEKLKNDKKLSNFQNQFKLKNNKKKIFLQLNEQLSQKPKDEGIPLPPVLVKVFDAKEPDQKVQTEMDNLEKERSDYEKKMFQKAEMELKLITAQTLQELQGNLESEMMPFFVASKNVLSNINMALSSKMDKLKFMRFVEKYSDEIKTYFPIHLKKYDSFKQNQNYSLSLKNETLLKENFTNIEINKDNNNSNSIKFLEKENYTLIHKEKYPNSQKFLDKPNEIENIVKMSSENENYLNQSDNLLKKNNENLNEKTDVLDNTNLNENTEKINSENLIDLNKNSPENLIKNTDHFENLEEENPTTPINSEIPRFIQKPITPPFSQSYILDEEACQDLKQKYPFLNFGCGSKTTIFLQLKESENLFTMEKSEQAGGGNSDNINVKVGASEIPYPTVYRLIYEMETRRDLAEKWERLKILEIEMNLQKAEDEMIKDALHQGVQKIIAKFGPAIEGVQENIR